MTVHNCACGDHVWKVFGGRWVSMLSPEDEHLFSRYGWYAHVEKTGRPRIRYNPRYRRADRKKIYTVVYLHRLVFDFGDKLADHVNRNTLDNRRSNLRPATPAENSRNSSPYRSKRSKYKGVRFQGKRFSAVIRILGKHTHLGTFAAETDAALAYDRAAKEHFGAFAAVNFPGAA